MSLTKDGFYKQIDGTIGDNTYLLLAGGGHIKNGNANGNVPLNNGVKNTNLYADILDGYHASDLLQSVTLGKISSSNNTLTQENTYIKVGGTELGTGSSTATIINSLSISQLSSDNTTNLTAGITINGKASEDKTLTNLIARQLSQSSISSSLSNFTDGYNLIYTAKGGGNGLSDKPTGVDAFGILSFKTADGWYGQLLMSSNESTGIYWRTATSLSGGWKKLLDSTNYTDYVYSKSSADNRYVLKSGDTMTGALKIDATPSQSDPPLQLCYSTSFSASDSTIGLMKFGHPTEHDAYLGIAPSSRTYFGKDAYFFHISYSKEFDWMSSGFEKLMALEASSGNLWVSGNLGVGVDPSYKLDVNGNVRIRGNNEYIGTGSGSQCHIQYDNTNKCLNFIFD